MCFSVTFLNCERDGDDGLCVKRGDEKGEYGSKRRDMGVGMGACWVLAVLAKLMRSSRHSADALSGHNLQDDVHLILSHHIPSSQR